MNIKYIELMDERDGFIWKKEPVRIFAYDKEGNLVDKTQIDRFEFHVKYLEEDWEVMMIEPMFNDEHIERGMYYNKPYLLITLQECED